MTWQKLAACLLYMATMMTSIKAIAFYNFQAQLAAIGELHELYPHNVDLPRLSIPITTYSTLLQSSALGLPKGAYNRSSWPDSCHLCFAADVDNMALQKKTCV